MKREEREAIHIVGPPKKLHSLAQFLKPLFYPAQAQTTHTASIKVYFILQKSNDD